MRALAEPVQIGDARRLAEVDLRWTDEDERRVGHEARDLGDEIEIHPAVDAADVPHNRTGERGKVGGHRIGGCRHALEFLEAHAERKEVHLPAERRRALAQLFGRDKHKVRFAEQLPFRLDDFPRRLGARGEIVDAVVHRNKRIQGRDDVAHQRRRQERPDDRATESDGAHPAAKGADQQEPVDAAHDGRVRERQENRRVDEQVVALAPESLGPTPPVVNPLTDARQVAHRRRAHARVFDEQDAIAIRGQRRHDLLVSLPDELPVDGGKADDVLPRQYGGLAHACRHVLYHNSNISNTHRWCA